MKLLGDNKVTLLLRELRILQAQTRLKDLSRLWNVLRWSYTTRSHRGLSISGMHGDISMLGNPKTHIRNVLGNAIFVPVRGMKNVIGATIEAATVKGERSKAIGKLPKTFKEFAAINLMQIRSY